MSALASALAGLRRRLDEIDDGLHDLLMQRAAVVAEVAATKRALGGNVGGPSPQFVYPAREASILRRLLARNRAPLSPELVVRVWREVISASVRQQGALEIGALGGYPYLPAIAQEHFGLGTPVRSFRSTPELLEWLTATAGAVALFPLPSEDDPAEPWWLHLATAVAPPPRVVARLPVIARPADNALLVAPFEPDQSGDDESLVLVEHVVPYEPESFAAAFAAAGLAARPIGASRGSAAPGAPGAPGAPLAALFAVAGAATATAAALDRLHAALGHETLATSCIGGYALPIVLPPAA